MSERVERFDVVGVPQVFLRLPAGEARVVTGEEGVVEVRMSGRDSTIERFLIERRGGEIVIEPETGGRLGRWSGVDVEIRVGQPPAITARLASGDITIAAAAESLMIQTGAGDVVAGDVHRDAKMKTASGDIRINDVRGRLEVAAASGDVRAHKVEGGVAAKTAAGDIVVGEAGGSVSAHSASGDIEIERFVGESVNARTLSGDVRLGVTAGRRFSVSFQTLSGDVRTDFPVSPDKPDGATARLSVKTMSGDIVVRRAD